MRWRPWYLLFPRSSGDSRRPALVCQLISLAGVLILSATIAAAATTRTYTTDADFDEGVLVGLEHGSAHDQLQLSTQPGSLPFIWVPNNDGTVSKINTETGDELGRYWPAPPDIVGDASPSRTTVDLDGACWVGNRAAGTVVKIGLYEAGQWADRNGDGICQTSRDLDGDGNIEPDEVLPWGQDECVLLEIVLVPGYEGAYVPGTYTGCYCRSYWGVAPRGLAIDSSNNLWAGTWSTSKYYYISGDTGDFLRVIDVSPWGHCAYGATIDEQGVVWSAMLGNHVLRMDPSVDPPAITTTLSRPDVYGLGLDYLGHLFVSGSYQLSKLETATGAVDWSQYEPELGGARGVVCTSDNDVWVAAGSNVTRYDNNGSVKAVIGGIPTATGVAVDAAGKVWVCVMDDFVHRIDPATNAIDLSKQVIGSGGHYSYSDMTGQVVGQIATQNGTWTVNYDSGVLDDWWGVISWNGNEPTGTAISVRVRASNDQTDWSSWEPATNGSVLPSAVRGRYLQVEARLRVFTGSVSPILYDLTVSDVSRVVQLGDGDAIPSRRDTVPAMSPDVSGAAMLFFGVTYNIGRGGLLTLTGAAKGSALPDDWVFTWCDLAPGEGRICAYSPDGTELPVGSSGVLAELEFETSVDATTNERCILHPHNMILQNGVGDLISPVAGADGSFTVALGYWLRPYVSPEQANGVVTGWGVYLPGEVVTVNAYANPGWVFDYWEGPVADPNSATTTITMDASYTIYGHFRSVGLHTIGLYDPAAATFRLRNSNSPGSADITFRFGSVGWSPIVGDWDADTKQTAGVYNPTTGMFYLRNSNSAGAANTTFRFGPAPSTWLPIAGDWNGDGADTIGLYNPAAGTFYLKNANSPGGADVTFRFGPAPSTWLPIAGDWNGDGADTIGLYNPATGTFYLKYVNSPGAADITFRYGPTASTWKPIVGDWNQDWVETVGLYNPATSTFYLRNSNSPGVADLTFRYGPTSSTWKPIVGDWDGM